MTPPRVSSATLIDIRVTCDDESRRTVASYRYRIDGQTHRSNPPGNSYIIKKKRPRSTSPDGLSRPDSHSPAGQAHAPP